MSDVVLGDGTMLPVKARAEGNMVIIDIAEERRVVLTPEVKGKKTKRVEWEASLELRKEEKYLCIVGYKTSEPWLVPKDPHKESGRKKAFMKLLTNVGEMRYNKADAQKIMEGVLAETTINREALRQIQLNLLKEAAAPKPPPNLQELIAGLASKRRMHPALDFDEKGEVLTYGLSTEAVHLFIDSKGEAYSQEERKMPLSTAAQVTEPRLSTQAMSGLLLSKDSKGVDPVALYGRIRERLRHFVDFPDEAVYDICACWVMGTYMFPLFHAYPYLYFNAVFNSGKSRTLEVLANMSFNSVLAGDITGPALFRLVQSLRATVLFDEAEKLRQSNDEDATMIKYLLNSGYKRGAKVWRTEEVERKRQVVGYEIYSPKALASINSPDGTLKSRCITVVLHRALDSAYGGREPIPSDPEWQEIRDGLYLFALRNFSGILDIYRNLRPLIKNRDWELWKPLMTIALYIDKRRELAGKKEGPSVFSRLKDYASRDLERKMGEEALASWDITLIRVLHDMVKQRGWYNAKDIAQRMLAYFTAPPKYLNAEWVQRAMQRVGYVSAQRFPGRGPSFLLEPKFVEDLARRYRAIPGAAFDRGEGDEVLFPDRPEDLDAPSLAEATSGEWEAMAKHLAEREKAEQEALWESEGGKEP